MSVGIVPYFGLSEVMEDKVGCAKALVAELIGTMMLVLVGCGACTGGDQPGGEDVSDQANIVRIALAFGITVATMAQTVGHVSGCHINPAITAGLVVGQKIGLVKAVLYVLVQCVGAILGAAILSAVLPSDVRGVSGLGITSLNPNITEGQGFGIEFLITMILVLVVFGAAADANNDVRGSAPLAIGLSITTAHLFAVPFTGASMNPARSLGPSLVTNQFGSHWVYWAGPILGGVFAGLLYQLVFQATPKRKYVGVESEDKV